MNHYKSIGLNLVLRAATPAPIDRHVAERAPWENSEAKAAMRWRQIALKGEAVGKAIAIVEYLRVSLDPGIDAAFSEQLGELYRYIELGFWKRTLKTIQRL